MLYLIRHGQRSDIGNLKEFLKMKKKHDPHLTSIGEFMAYKTGELISKEHNYKKFPLITLSSPYLRCIQTTENILKGIAFAPGDEVMAGNTIFLEDSLRELQGPEAYVDPNNYWHITSMEHLATKTSDIKSFTLNPPKPEKNEGKKMKQIN
jgi:broad specificity phosphatase PhoE